MNDIRLWGWLITVIGGALAFGSWQDSLDAGLWMGFALMTVWRVTER